MEAHASTAGVTKIKFHWLRFLYQLTCVTTYRNYIRYLASRSVPGLHEMSSRADESLVQRHMHLQQVWLKSNSLDLGFCINLQTTYRNYARCMASSSVPGLHKMSPRAGESLVRKHMHLGKVWVKSNSIGLGFCINLYGLERIGIMHII